MKGFVTIETPSTKNLGDEIQIIAAQKFVDKYRVATVDRERLSDYDGPRARIIMNGWYLHNSDNWPPSSKLEPLITSFHITDLKDSSGKDPREVLTKKGQNRDFLVSNGPIGARDIETYRFLLQHSIPTYFSGCLTLTLENKRLPKKDYICSVDAGDQVNRHLQSLTDSQIVYLENSSIPKHTDYNEKLALAQDTLDKYEQAKVVITTRLHAALPSLALGTPVILINNKNIDSSRYLGLKDLVRNCDAEDFLAGMYNELINSPTDNSDSYKTIANHLNEIVECFVSKKKLPDLQTISSENLAIVLQSKEKNESELRDFYRYLFENSGKKRKARSAIASRLLRGRRSKSV